jgi:hypothetical protein
LTRASESLSVGPEAPSESAEMLGYQLMNRQLALNLEGLQQRLAKTARKWKI